MFKQSRFLQLISKNGTTRTRDTWYNVVMELLKERFLAVYANIPLGLRNGIILVLKDKGPITWNVAYLEVKMNTGLSNSILKALAEIGII